jgi:non-ribosomal peptide synthetase component F
VVGEDLKLSYADLNARVNRLAQHIVARNVRPEQVVAVALPRSVELVVALLAVLEAGAAYLPVDLDYPTERIRFIFDDAAPVAVVTTTAVLAMLPESDAVLRILVDINEIAGETARYPCTDLTEFEQVRLPVPRVLPISYIPRGQQDGPRGLWSRIRAWSTGCCGCSTSTV